MNKNKGFTLIELLTVIVVLAIIALITVPIVNGITRRAGKSAFRQSAVGILNTIKLDRASSGYTSLLENDMYIIKDQKIYFEEEPIGTKHIGEITGVGDAYVDREGNQAIGYTNNKWCAYKTYNDTKVKVKSGNCDDIGVLCDMTAPESVDFSYTVTLNRIKIVVNAKDSESGISKYEYSKDGGITWQTAENPQNNIYEYKDLLFNTKYQIKVRVYNGLTEKENCRENIETTESEIKEVKTEILKAPIIEVTPKGLAKEKEATISYDGIMLEGFKIMYSLNDGEFREYTGIIKITENNTTIIGRITDGTNVVDKTEKVINIDNAKPIISVKDINEEYSKKDEITIEVDDIEENGSAVSGVTHYCITNENSSENCTWESITGKTGKYEINSNGTYYAYSKDLVGNISEGYMFIIDKIDTEKPTATLEITNTTTNSIEVKATCTDNIGIKSYEYSSDNGLNYKTGTNNIYTFSNLKTGTYNLKVRCTDEAGNSTEASTVGTTGEIKIPSFTVTDSGVWTQSKIVTITYPDGNYTKKYRVINGTATKEDGTIITNGTWYEVSGKTDKIVLKSNGNIEAKISDGINEISSSKNVTMIDTTGPSAPIVMKAVKGDWTIVNLSQWQNVDIYFPLVTLSGEALVTGSVDNESGILKYQISADKVTWYDLGAYTATGVYVTSGTTTRYYRAINNAGVAGAVASINVYIDKIAPTISYNYNAQSLTNLYNGAYYMGFFSSGIRPTLTLTDTGGSGLSSNNQISIWKDGTWVNNAVSIGNNQWSIPMLTDGRWIPHIIARDNAGNISIGTRSDGNHLTVWDVDTTKPTVSYSVAGGSYDTAQTVRVTANDTNYSYMYVHVYKDGVIQAISNNANPTTASYYDVPLDSDGSWIIYAKVYDNAGNIQNQSPVNGSGWYYQTYTINTAPPTSTITVKTSSGTNVTNGAIVAKDETYTVTIGCSAGSSGVKSYSWNTKVGTSVIKSGTTNTFTIQASDAVFTCPSECSTNDEINAGKACDAACAAAAQHGVNCGRDCTQEAQDALNKCCKEKCESANSYDCTSYGGTIADSIPISITANCTNNSNKVSNDVIFGFTMKTITCTDESTVTCTNGSLSGDVYTVCKDVDGNVISKTFRYSPTGSCGGAAACAGCENSCKGVGSSSYQDCMNYCKTVNC